MRALFLILLLSVSCFATKYGRVKITDGDEIAGVTPDSALYVAIKEPVEANGGVPVNLQDQTSAVLIVKFNQVTNTTVTTTATTIDGYTVGVADTAGIVAGKYFIVFSEVTGRVYVGEVVSITDSTVTVDSPFDSELPIGSDVDISITNMAVDGSSTPQVFGIRGQSVGEPVGVAFDITRVIFKMTTTSAVNYDLFGNLAKLTRGLVLRKRDGVYQNIFNIKDNGELAGVLYDFTVAESINPAQGRDGLLARLTFGGQSKIGVVIRLEPGEDLEFIVQDDLLTAQGGESITLFEVIAEGHAVTD